jgi:lysophospholipase L1-like esterase
MSLSRRAVLAAPALLAPLPVAAARPPLAAEPIGRLETRWWRDRHEDKLRALRAHPPELLFLGDSITQNWEKSGPRAWQDFRPAWERYYGGRQAANLGFSGDATSHLLWRMMHGELDGIAPKAAVILIGANNLGRLHWPADDDVLGIRAVVDEARRRLPRTKLLLLGVLPSIRSAWASETTGKINRALAEIYGGGLVPGVVYRDVGGVFMRAGKVDAEAFYDPLLTPPEPPLHPTAQAQARMAAAYEPVLAELLGDRARV